MASFDSLSTDYVFGEASNRFTHYLIFPASKTHTSFIKQVSFDRHTRVSNLEKAGVVVRQGQPPKGSRFRPEPLG